MNDTETIKKLGKFFLDPDWVLVERMITEYIEPLRDISTIDLSANSEAVHAEIAGRVKAYESMTKFLKDCRVLGRKSTITSTSFK